MVPSEPKPEDFRIEDIAHALSMVCRGNGHDVRPFAEVEEEYLDLYYRYFKDTAARDL